MRYHRATISSSLNIAQDTPSWNSSRTPLLLLPTVYHASKFRRHSAILSRPLAGITMSCPGSARFIAIYCIPILLYFILLRFVGRKA